MLQWFDATIAAPAPIGPLSHCTMTVLYGTEPEIAPTLQQDLPAPTDWLVVRWSGFTHEW